MGQAAPSGQRLAPPPQGLDILGWAQKPFRCYMGKVVLDSHCVSSRDVSTSHGKKYVASSLSMHS